MGGASAVIMIYFIDREVSSKYGKNVSIYETSIVVQGLLYHLN